MIRYRVLYYPDFTPEEAWLRRILLLCDSVLRIVPADVRPEDSAELLRLQDAVPDCLQSIAPIDDDIAVDREDLPRLARVFAILRGRRQKMAGQIEINIARDASLSIADHVFLHDEKMSAIVQTELRRNGLVIDSLRGLAPSPRFMVVQRDASNVILAGLASRIARRLGVDAITTEPVPFSFGALQRVPARANHGVRSEGALLSAIAALMIPAAAGRLKVADYIRLRDSYAEIRQAFMALTTELSALHRLPRLNDAGEFSARVESIAREFQRQYREYRKSRYARHFKSWAPLCVGGALSVAAAVVDPLVAAGMAVVSVGIQVMEKRLSGPTGDENTKVFHLLAGMRRDIIDRSGIHEIV